MFGLGFTEILFIAVIAIIFLGPDKLPETMVQIAKFMGNFRRTISDAKSSFENEVNLNELKEQASSYRDTITSVGDDISGFKNSISNPVDDLNQALKGLDDDLDSGSDDDIVDFSKKKKKKKSESSKEKKEIKSENEA